MESVSVIIPTYNRAHLVPRAVASALDAMAPGDELIVVDDGSTDNTVAALEPFRDRIRYLRKANGGVAAARNHGIRHAQHPLVTFLDSDDTWMPDSLLIRRRLMEARPDLVFCFTDFALRMEDGSTERKFLVSWHHDYRSWDEILAPGVRYSSIAALPPGRDDFNVHIGDMYPLLLQRTYVPAWTSLVRRDLAGADFRMEENIRILEEIACFGRMARHGPAAFLDCETAWNHGHTGARVTSDAGVIGVLDSRVQIAERIWGQDEAFLREHGELYARLLTDTHTSRARWYLSRGMTSEARQAIVDAGESAPRALRMLAMLPAPVLSALGGVRRRTLDVVNRAGAKSARADG